MTAELTIEFDDGTTESIILDRAIQINTDPEKSLQALEFRETRGGKWVMVLTTGLWKGRNFKNISVKKVVA